jgi:hypothetical protein
MAALPVAGVPSNNLAQQLAMFNKNKKGSGNLSKGKKLADPKDNNGYVVVYVWSVLTLLITQSLHVICKWFANMLNNHNF